MNSMSAAVTVSPIDRSIPQANGLPIQTGSATGGTPFASLLAGQSLSDLAALGLSQSANLNARLANNGLAVRAPERAAPVDRPRQDQIRESDEDTEDRAPDGGDAVASATGAVESTAGLDRRPTDTTASLPVPLTNGNAPGTVEPQSSATRPDIAARAPAEFARPQPDQGLQRPSEQSPTPLKAQVTEPQKSLVSQPNSALSARAAVTAQIAADKSAGNPSLNGGLISKANHGSLTAANTLAQHSHGQTAASNAIVRGQIRPQTNTGTAGTAGGAGTAAAKAQLAATTGQPATHTTTGAANARMPFAAGLTGSGQSGIQQPAPQFADLASGSGTTLTHAPEGSRGAGTAPALRAHPPVPPRVVTNQVAVQIQKAVAQGTDRINIQLKPAELGRVEIRLDVAQDGRVSAVISVERQDTLDLLQRDARTLQATLQDAGLKTNSDSLNFELRQNGSTTGNDNHAENTTGDSEQSSDEQGPTDTPVQSGLVTQDRIDIQI